MINVPSSFTIIWAAVKPWLAPETVAKVVIFGIIQYPQHLFFLICLLGGDYQSFLLEYVDSENLPVEFGGTCTCAGIGGCAFSSDGPWIEGRTYTGHGPSKYKPKFKEEPDNPEPDTEKEKDSSLHADTAAIEVKG